MNKIVKIFFIFFSAASLLQGLPFDEDIDAHNSLNNDLPEFKSTLVHVFNNDEVSG